MSTPSFDSSSRFARRCWICSSRDVVISPQRTPRTRRVRRTQRRNPVRTRPLIHYVRAVDHGFEAFFAPFAALRSTAAPVSRTRSRRNHTAARHLAKGQQGESFTAYPVCPLCPLCRLCPLYPLCPSRLITSSGSHPTSR